jgi:hypothetical protein
MHTETVTVFRKKTGDITDINKSDYDADPAAYELNPSKAGKQEQSSKPQRPSKTTAN